MVHDPSPKGKLAIVCKGGGGQALTVYYSSWVHASLVVHKGPQLSELGPIRTEPETDGVNERQDWERKHRQGGPWWFYNV